MPATAASDVFARLSALLTRADSAQALTDACAVARELGIVPAEESSLAPFLTLTRAERTLSLALLPGATLPDSARTLATNLLGAVFTCAAEQDELQRVRERMELLSAASFEGLFFHVHGEVFDFNARFQEMSGYATDEILGNTLMYRCVAAEEVPAMIERMLSGYEGPYVVTGVRKDGSRFPAELQAKQGKLGKTPVRVVAVRDVTERERTQALLRESETRLRGLAEHTFDIIAFSRDGVIIDVAGKLEEVLGYTREELVGHQVLDFVPKEALAYVTPLIVEQRLGVSDTVVLSKSGESVPMEIVAIMTTLQGEPVRVSAMRDLREARRLERERRNLELALERSQRLDSLGVLAGGIAHDFNNLLTVMLGSAELLEMRVENPRDRELAQAIVDAGKRASGLTKEMLAYAGRGEVGPRASLDLGALITELRTLLDATLSKKAQVVLDLAEGCVVLGNRATLTQVVMNLLVNASDALAGECGTIALRTRVVTEPDARFAHALGAKLTAERYVLLEVSDTGVGMDEATQTRIFEPFFTTKSTGHGLGLAACIGIVRSHGGAIVVESEQGRGSTFSVLLPTHDGEPNRAVVRTRPAPSTGPHRLLVVDDELLVCNYLRAALEEHGYAVDVAYSGKSALEALKRQEPSLILLDMTMPDFTGVEVLQRIRESGSSVPVILASGYHDAALELDPGSYQGFLVKPFSPDELVEAVARALDE